MCADAAVALCLAADRRRVSLELGRIGDSRLLACCSSAPLLRPPPRRSLAPLATQASSPPLAVAASSASFLLDGVPLSSRLSLLAGGRRGDPRPAAPALRHHPHTRGGGVHRGAAQKIREHVRGHTHDEEPGARLRRRTEGGTDARARSGFRLHRPSARSLTLLRVVLHCVRVGLCCSRRTLLSLRDHRQVQLDAGVVRHLTISAARRRLPSECDVRAMLMSTALRSSLSYCLPACPGLLMCVSSSLISSRRLRRFVRIRRGAVRLACPRTWRIDAWRSPDQSIAR